MKEFSANTKGTIPDNARVSNKMLRQNMLWKLEIWTADLCSWQCLTLEPLGQFQSVLHESNGKTTHSPKASLKKLQSKIVWNGWDFGISQCLTLELLGQFRSVLHENSWEFSAQSNGKTSDSPKASLKKLRPKCVLNLWDWNSGPLHLTMSNFGTIGENSKCFTWKQLRIFCPIQW